MAKAGWFFLSGILGLFLVGADAFSGGEGADEAVIKITARKFAYTPSRIELRTGVPVILELISLDRIHGFNIPGMELRADVLPGQGIQVKLMPGKPGRYAFLCDIFCGNGHDDMNGVIIVRD